jgi:hypothetical protein
VGFRPRHPGSGALVRGLLGLALALAVARPGLALAIDPSQSSIVPEVGSPESLSGALTLTLGQLPVAQNTTMDVTFLAATSSGGIAIALDPASPSPGAGVVSPAGAFLIPTLFLRVQDALGSFDLAVSNVTGTVVFDSSSQRIERLSTAFEIDSGGPGGVLQVTVVAALPEPGGLALAGAALGVLLAARRRGVR